MQESIPSPNKDKIEALLKKAHIPGISIAYINNGKIQSEATGCVEKTSHPPTLVNLVNKDTVFRAASLSKPVFAYLVSMLIKNKIITLDENLYKIFQDPQITESKFCEQLTPELVLSHQTGLPGNDPIVKFHFEPGKGFEYSGSAYYYLQQAIEAKTGQSLEALAQKYVFGPLHMNHSSFVQPKPGSTIAIGHDEKMNPDRPPPEESRQPKAYAPYTLQTTAEDYALLIAELLREQNLSDPILKKAFEPLVFMTQDKWANETSTNKNELEKIAWGLGWGLQIIGDQKYAFHWGDVGSSKAFVLINLNDKSSVIYFANSFNGLSIAPELMEIYMPGKNLKPLFNYIFEKYGYQDCNKPGWEKKQKQETWHNVLRELHDKPAWLAFLQKNNILGSVEADKSKQTLSFQCSPNSAYYKIMMNELDIFMTENHMDELDDCEVKTIENSQNKDMPTTIIHISKPELYNKFISRLNDLQILPATQAALRETQGQGNVTLSSSLLKP